MIKLYPQLTSVLLLYAKKTNKLSNCYSKMDWVSSLYNRSTSLRLKILSKEAWKSLSYYESVVACKGNVLLFT